MVLDSIEQRRAGKDLDLDNCYVTGVAQWRSIIALIQDFFFDMVGNNKDTAFPSKTLERLLQETEFLSDET
ncbi:MAG: hypothetical protein WBG38_07515 [Nodosilinea sp.]